MKKNKKLIEITILAVILFAFIFGWSSMEKTIYDLWPSKFGNVGAYNLVKLAGEFIRISFLGCIVSVVFGISIGLWCFTKIGREFKPLIEKFSTLSRSVPITAIIVIVIKVVGVGVIPATVALVFHGSLPVIFSTISGIESIAPIYIEVAQGLGMKRSEVLFKVEIPMALPVILSGIRVTSIICIAAATLGYNTGAGGLGLLISTGYDTYNTVFLFEGTFPICIFAILSDKVIRLIEDYFYKIRSCKLDGVS